MFLRHACIPIPSIPRGWSERGRTFKLLFQRQMTLPFVYTPIYKSLGPGLHLILGFLTKAPRGARESQIVAATFALERSERTKGENFSSSVHIYKWRPGQESNPQPLES